MCALPNGIARLLLTGQMLEHFNVDISEALQPEAGKKYGDILTIVNSYVRLVDTSGTYPEYADEAAEKERIDEEQVTYYTEQRLQTLKREHEQWVTDRFSSTIPAIKIRDPEADKPVMLQRIDTGKELMNYGVASANDAIRIALRELLRAIKKMESGIPPHA